MGQLMPVQVPTPSNALSQQPAKLFCSDKEPFARAPPKLSSTDTTMTMMMTMMMRPLVVHHLFGTCFLAIM
jgi:hypothetical protein